MTSTIQTERGESNRIRRIISIDPTAVTSTIQSERGDILNSTRDDEDSDDVEILANDTNRNGSLDNVNATHQIHTDAVGMLDGESNRDGNESDVDIIRPAREDAVEAWTASRKPCEIQKTENGGRLRGSTISPSTRENYTDSESFNRSQFTEAENLSLSMAWVTQTHKMIQSDDSFWKGVTKI